MRSRKETKKCRVSFIISKYSNRRAQAIHAHLAIHFFSLFSHQPDSNMMTLELLLYLFQCEQNVFVLLKDLLRKIRRLVLLKQYLNSTTFRQHYKRSSLYHIKQNLSLVGCEQNIIKESTCKIVLFNLAFCIPKRMAYLIYVLI